MTKARRQQLMLTWVGIVAAWGASLVLEILLLGARSVVPVAVTTAVAVGAGMWVTRRLIAPIRRASIKVGDLHLPRRPRARTGN